MQRMRTIEAAMEYIRVADPETVISKNALRSLVKDGSIPSVRVGRKILVSLDNIDEFLRRGQVQKQVSGYGKIRPV